MREIKRFRILVILQQLSISPYYTIIIEEIGSIPSFLSSWIFTTLNVSGYTEMYYFLCHLIIRYVLKAGKNTARNEQLNLF